jgi:diguanylate cyclase (GGDEF)-like protein/PAS domain S-box-containing protein
VFGENGVMDPQTAGFGVDFTCLFEVMPHPYLILRVDVGFHIVAVNALYLTVTGTRREEILGRSVFDVFPDNPEDKSSSGVSDLRASLQRVLRDQTPDVMGVQKYDILPRDCTSDFRVKYWSPMNTPLVEADGSVSFIIHTVEDVTEFVLEHERTLAPSTEPLEKVEQHAKRVQAEVLRRAQDLKETNRRIKASEAKLAELNERLQDLNRMKTEFFSNVSHEFRTPLTVILGPLEGFLREPASALPPQFRTSLEMMYRNALRLLKLVNTLLDFSRVEAQRTAPHWQSTDLARFTRGVASSFESLCQQTHLELVVDCPPLGSPVQIDREMWEKILLNLLSNAFKFTFEGRIEVHQRCVGGQIELSVRDTGTGIAQDEQPRLFERFHRIRGARGRTYEGSGIGLALVKELIGLLGGTISVESTEGRGTCFTVRVPLSVSPPDDSADSGDSATLPGMNVNANSLARTFIEEARRWLPGCPEKTGEGGSPAPTSARILVVDDNADMRAYIFRLLREAGYAVTGAADGAAALMVCKAERPDLVLADVMMPVMNGFELLERLRADRQTSDLPIILLSARATEEFRIEGVRSGADDYVMKPFHASELTARVEAVLHRVSERKRAEAQLRQAAAVFTSTNEAVIITDAERRIVAVNGAFTRITGFEAEDVIGKSSDIQNSGRQDEAFYQHVRRALNSTGYWQGELWNRCKNGEIYPAWENISAVKDERGRVMSYVIVFSDIGSIKATVERLDHMAHHDALTGLPNRLLFSARFEQCLIRADRHRTHVALLLLDLDRFKLINDTLGHAAGDYLLQNVAERLRHCVRAEDTVARLGGDEFAIVLDEQSQREDAALVAGKILKQLSEPIMLEGQEHLPSASVGISVYPDDADSPENLIKAADAAMYRAKQTGMHGFAFYTRDVVR